MLIVTQVQSQTAILLMNTILKDLQPPLSLSSSSILKVKMLFSINLFGNY